MVKSPPELWAECSNAASLARHLGQFGEIRITKLEPETAVAWEGSAARGTVRLEPAGWGTKVILTATEQHADPAATNEPVPQEPAATEEPVAQEPVAAEPVAIAPEADESVAEEPVAEESTPEESTPEESTPEESTPEESTPEEPTPEAAASEAAEPQPRSRPSRWARLLGFFRAPPEPRAPEPDPEPEPERVPAAGPAPTIKARRPPVKARPADNPLDAALDSLGSAHHRPYSRA